MPDVEVGVPELLAEIGAQAIEIKVLRQQISRLQARLATTADDHDNGQVEHGEVVP